jgi:hypothetical protein
VKLVVIDGAPGVGNLTTARALAEAGHFPLPGPGGATEGGHRA